LDASYLLKRTELKKLVDYATLEVLEGRSLSELWWEDLTVQIFHFQARYNSLYAKYLDLLGVTYAAIKHSAQIPFLPIELFKFHEIQTGQWTPECKFSSSGTTGNQASVHLLRDSEWYRMLARRTFNIFYGPLDAYCIMALLPSYLERSGSSLVFMAEDFIGQTGHPLSGFYLQNLDELSNSLQICQKEDKPVILLGVSFALLDLAEKFPMPLTNTIIMETGGMKGRRKEITRESLHKTLKEAFLVPSVHSEYGMTELLSQAYSKGEGRFLPGPAMKISIREVTDPFTLRKPGEAGAVNITDFANLDTISFIATDDLGRTYSDGSFEILGRIDQSEIRGCNLMVE
jgi:hypothetical protein